MRHVYRIERLVDGIVVETIRPSEGKRVGAVREARRRAVKLGNPHRIGGQPDRLRVLNVSTDMVVVTYERRSGRVVKV
jgi:hypothetical protein